MIDYRKLLKESAFFDDFEEYELKVVEYFMKEVIKKSLPIILNKVADKAKAIDNTYSMGGWGMKGGSVSVSKESITSLEQEILKELL